MKDKGNVLLTLKVTHCQLYVPNNYLTFSLEVEDGKIKATRLPFEIYPFYLRFSTKKKEERE